MNFLWQIDQDFGLLFGDATSAKLLEKWSTSIKPKVIAQSRGLTQTCELQDLIQNAEATVEVEEGNYIVVYIKLFKRKLCIQDKHSDLQSVNCAYKFTH